MTFFALVESKLPVGSSAKMSAGSLASANAMATRCCSPPLNESGRFSALADMRTKSSRALARSWRSLLAEVSIAKATTWQIDGTHSSVEFAVTHMMFTTVRGRFKSFKGTIHVDDENPDQSSVEVEIDGVGTLINPVEAVKG